MTKEDRKSLFAFVGIGATFGAICGGAISFLIWFAVTHL